jgi:hypothetical protein
MKLDISETQRNYLIELIEHDITMYEYLDIDSEISKQEIKALIVLLGGD